MIHLETLLNTTPPVDNDSTLFEQALDVLNIGLEGFADEMAEQGTTVTHINWRPPAGGDAELADILSKLGS